ncbi:hypothetical protein [Hymenobacter sp. BT559]|uniref:hypothetical protein n=1 Tax=Hymenobacter sp. BT559 TaxID=2795729 RepID=UPI0018EC1353|nr:hypothetical protein [Hymenobacter sp. BT559]MBJ6146288.1 hypothetical protein [Hymenobacter sp. BT559]
MPNALQNLQAYHNSHYHILCSWSDVAGEMSVYYDFQLAGTVPLNAIEMLAIKNHSIPKDELFPLGDFEQALQ